MSHTLYREDLRMLEDFGRHLELLLKECSDIGVNDFKIYVGENSLQFLVSTTDGIVTFEEADE